MFGKKPPKCPRCGKRLSKHKVWHAKTGTFEFETKCVLCSSKEDNPKTSIKDEDNETIRYKARNELEKEQSDRETSRIEENKTYEEFIKKEKERAEEVRKSIEIVTDLIKNGSLLYSEGKLQESIDCYDKALEIDPDNIDAWKGKGDVLAKAGKYDEATRYFNRILAINPNNIGALTSKADVLAKRGKHDLAIKYFDKILEIQPNNAFALERREATRQESGNNKQTLEDKREERQELRYKPLVVDKTSEFLEADKIHAPAKAEASLYGNCAKFGCDEKLHGLNSKACKLCEQQVCLKHLQPEKHDCPKVIYVPYIRKTWIRKHGQNVSSGVYTVVCDTCGYVSDFPSLIEQAGAILESHLQTSEQCLKNKKTFLEELVAEPITPDKVRSSISTDPNRRFWVCAHCRPPRKFTSRDDYISHHFTHN